MKKSYIIPASTTYAVNTKDGILLGLSNSEADPNATVQTKEENTSGSGIWDLYN